MFLAFLHVVSWSQTISSPLIVPVEEAKPVVLDPHPLEHRDEQVRQRIVVFAVEREVLAVPEAAAGEERRQVRRRVRVGVAEVGAVQDHRAVEQRLAVFPDGLSDR